MKPTANNKPTEKSEPRQPRPVERASINQDGLLAETVYSTARTPHLQFAVKADGLVTIAPTLTLDGKEFTPPRDPNGMIEKGVVLLPSQAAPYGSQAELVADIKAFIDRYALLPPFWTDLIAHYVLMSWVFDRFTAVPYLRFLGEPATGKSRLLQICVHICYKGISAGGSTTTSPMFRLMELYGGTLAIDEADYKDTDTWADVTKIMNSGYMRGAPVIRSEKVGDSYEPRAYDVFGPKVIGNRTRFADRALETRCITLETELVSLSPQMHRQIPPAFYDEARALRNKLLQWRFDNFARIQTDESALLHLAPRLTQIGSPLYSVSGDPAFRQRLVVFLTESDEEQRTNRPQALIVEAISRLSRYGAMTVGQVANEAKSLAEQREMETHQFSSKAVGGLVRSLGFKPKRTGSGFRFEVTETRLRDLVAQYPIATETIGSDQSLLPKPFLFQFSDLPEPVRVRVRVR